MMKKVFIILLFCFGLSSLMIISGQNAKIDQRFIINNFINQELNFPQEKLYVHTDRNSYWAGENIYFKAHLVSANFHIPQLYSHYVYVELINASNRVIKRVKIRNTENSYEGYIPVRESLPEGFYTIRAYTNFMRNMDESFFFRSFVYIKNQESVRKKIVPAFDYGTNGEVNISLQFVDLRDDSLYIPVALNVEINNKKVSSLKWDANKTARFSFKPDSKDNRSILYVEAEDYRKYIFIPSPTRDFEVSFYPEGGQLLEGINSCVAFKAMNPDGDSEEITGEIVNESGDSVAPLQTSYDGRGLVYFTPQSGTKYYAICENREGVKKRFELPVALKEGVALSAKWVNDLLYVSAPTNNKQFKNSALHLLVHTRGAISYFEKWNPANEYIIFNKETLNEGISHLLLLDDGGNIVSERLVFSGKYTEPVQPELLLEKKNFSAREKVTTSLSISNIDNDSLHTNLSLLVRDVNAVIPHLTPSLRSYLLLNADLKDELVNSDFYFEDNNSIAKRAMDMLMLTCEWKRHSIQEIITGKLPEPKELFEIGQEIGGKVKSFIRRKPVRNSEVSIISMENSFADKVITDKSGSFSFNGFEFPDSTAYVIQALSAKGTEHVELTVEEDHFPEVNLSIPAAVWKYEKQLSKNVYSNYSGYSGADERHIFLGEVEIKARFRDKQEASSSPYTRLADQSFSLRDIEELDATCLHELFRRIPGLRVDGEKVYIRGSNSIYGDSKAALFIDGVYIDSDLDLDVVNMPDVQQVDVFKTGNTVIWGTRGGNGVVSITTKRGDFLPSEKQQYNIKRITPLGYQNKLPFEAPDYGQPSLLKDNLPDLRTTIFWQPAIYLTGDSVKEVSFYTADTSTQYEIIVEGITDEGEIIYYKDFMEVY